MPSRHSELVAFFERIGSGAASTWARDETAVGDRELVHMAEGRGEELRADSKRDRYRCVLPSCGEPLTVSAGPTLRHHWRHRGPVSAAHTPETIWHETAKAALAAFARAARPDAQVLVDERRTPAGAQPDVWVQLPSGSVAFEAQYSEITTTSVRERTERYRLDGITAVWLFAHHHPPELGPLRAAAAQVGAGGEAGHPGEVRLKAGHRAAAEGGPLRWLNPDQRSVATAYVRTVQRPDEHRGEVWTVAVLEPIEYVRHASPSDMTVSLMVDALQDCTLDEHGLHTPSDEWIAAAAAAADELERRSARRYQLSRHRDDDAPPGDDADDPGRVGEQVPVSVRDRDVIPAPRPRRVYDPTGRTSPCCRAEPVRQFGWPDWYRPPEGTIAVYVCAECDTVLGSTNR